MRIQKKISNGGMLFELLAVMGIYAILAAIVICILTDRILYELMGFACGIAAASFMIIHMAVSIDTGVQMGETGALKHMRRTYAVRMLVLIVFMGAVLFFDLGGAVSLIFGLASLKVAAYLQPFTHKLIKYLSKGR